MTPEQADTLRKQMLDAHQVAMADIATKSKENAEKWATVTGRMAERFAPTGERVAEILEEMQPEADLS